jgi:tetratricopeptide (TPR) repeat protein
MQRLRGDQSVQISHVSDSTIAISYGESAHQRVLPLEPATLPRSGRAGSPVRIIRARSGVIDFVDRGGLLEDLVAWMHSPQPFAGGVIGGPAGSGKTKLGVALCARAEAAGWLCGLLSRSADQGAVDALVHVPAARLIVVDYAETRAEQLARLAPVLAASSSMDYPVRLVLLVRARPHASSDWAALLRGRADAFDELLDSMAAWSLQAHPLTELDRATLFRTTWVAISAHTGESRPAPISPPFLSNAVFASPLMVVIAAYLAMHDRQDPPTSKFELLAQLLVHEQRYWCSCTDRAGPADPTLQRRVVALATLTAARDERGASDLLRLVPDLEDASAERLGVLARWASSLYPSGEQFWSPVEPDLVGEYLVATTYARYASTLDGVLALQDADSLLRPLDVFARAAAEHPEFRKTVAATLSARVEALCELAIEQSTSTTNVSLLLGDGTLAAAIERVVRTIAIEATPLALALDHVRPHLPNLVLSPLALSLSQQLIAQLRRTVDDDPNPSLLALALNDGAILLGEVGRVDEAIAAIAEAVALRRQLAEAGTDIAIADVGMSLTNQANLLSSAGHDEEALIAIDEAVPIYRRVARSTPAEFLPVLIVSLIGRSTILQALGRHEEALAAINEAKVIAQRLAKSQTDYSLRDFVVTVGNESSVLIELGRGQEAATAMADAISLCRRFVKSRPDAFLPDLAAALSKGSNVLSAVERRGDALVAIEEAVDIYRQLAARRPDAFLSDLATSLSQLGSKLDAVARSVDALDAIAEAVAIHRKLAATRPYVGLPDLADSLNDLAISRFALERYEDALANVSESIEIQRHFAASESSQASRGRLARSLSYQANILSATGRHGAALVSVDEALALQRRLHDTRRRARPSDVATTLSNRAIVLSELGRDDEALEAIQEAIGIRRELVAQSDDSSLPELIMALHNQATVLSAKGRHAAAADACDEAIQLALPMLEDAPYYLPDAGANLLENYRRRCHDARRAPDPDTIARMRAVLASANPRHRRQSATSTTHSTPVRWHR